MNKLSLGLAALLIAGLCTAQAADKKDDVKEKIVGVWIPVKDNGIKINSVEFTKDAKLKVSIEIDGKEQKLEGTYKVDDEGVKFEIKDPDGNEHKDTLKVKKLTDKELVTENGKGDTTEFKKK
jgi:uncharacterized protein (TIGR03066 family)